jgi:hypothetical protein
MASVEKVKSWMNFWGWSDGGNPGSVKKDAMGNVVARHGDATWLNDVNLSILRTERDAESDKIMDEIEAAQGRQ